MPAKVENYSPKDTQSIVAAYQDAGDEMTENGHNARAAVVKILATEFGKSERSIRSKLVTQKVYIARGAKSKVTGEAPAKKETIAQNIILASGLNFNADSLAKANKTDLVMLLGHFNENLMVEMQDEAESNEPDETDEQETVATTTG